eukprot:PhF_6_TR25811/c0_g1_i1/m.36427
MEFFPHFRRNPIVVRGLLMMSSKCYCEEKREGTPANRGCILYEDISFSISDLLIDISEPLPILRSHISNAMEPDCSIRDVAEKFLIKWMEEDAPSLIYELN